MATINQLVAGNGDEAQINVFDIGFNIAISLELTDSSGLAGVKSDKDNLKANDFSGISYITSLNSDYGQFYAYFSDINNQSTTNISLIPCNSSQIFSSSINKDLIKSASEIGALLCLKDVDKLPPMLRGIMYNNQQTQITLGMVACANKTENYSNCKSSELIQSYFGSLKAKIYYQNANFNSKRYNGEEIEWYIEELGFSAQVNNYELSVQEGETELLDSYFTYWIMDKMKFALVDSIWKGYKSDSIFEISLKLSNKKSVYLRVADTIFSGLESIGGFFESLMHIGTLLVCFFQERLFIGSFLKQLYQVTTDVILTRKVDERQMVRQVSKVNNLNEDFLKAVLDFIVLKRQRFQYGTKQIIDYMIGCLCMRKKNVLHVSQNKVHFLYNKGQDKLRQELDIVNLVRQIRQLRLMAQVLLKPSERLLLKFQRKNVIETTSSSSDSDHQNYDTVKLLNSKQGLVKLQQIVKIKKILEQYRDISLEPVDKNLFKGIFRRKQTTTKPAPNTVVSEELSNHDSIQQFVKAPSIHSNKEGLMNILSKNKDTSSLRDFNELSPGSDEGSLEESSLREDIYSSDQQIQDSIKYEDQNTSATKLIAKQAGELILSPDYISQQSKYTESNNVQKKVTLSTKASIQKADRKQIKMDKQIPKQQQIIKRHSLFQHNLDEFDEVDSSLECSPVTKRDMPTLSEVRMAHHRSKLEERERMDSLFSQVVPHSGVNTQKEKRASEGITYICAQTLKNGKIDDLEQGRIIQRKEKSQGKYYKRTKTILGKNIKPKIRTDPCKVQMSQQLEISDDDQLDTQVNNCSANPNDKSKFDDSMLAKLDESILSSSLDIAAVLVKDSRPRGIKEV
ncbi:hypothetical protein FGO68_gene6627 [Halteria grandinella]|uniref:Uncharacterized protein n=1 Tax=Halteria grandinella TaxID=5974 RepID=A0A8J8T6S3_HALGN|nr:hypothetical protein FGO68_gene6627 [Halteria grandinella]